jgi:hypothetical protein
MEFFSPKDNILDLLKEAGDDAEKKKLYCHPGDFYFKAKINLGESNKTAVNKIKISLSTKINEQWNEPKHRPITYTVSTGDKSIVDINTVFKIKKAYDDLKIEYEYYKDNEKVEMSPSITGVELK